MDILNVEIDKDNRIAVLKPDGPLSEHDFVRASEMIDLWISEGGGLVGLIVSAKVFPGWETFGAF